MFQRNYRFSQTIHQKILLKKICRFFGYSYLKIILDIRFFQPLRNLLITPFHLKSFLEMQIYEIDDARKVARECRLCLSDY